MTDDLTLTADADDHVVRYAQRPRPFSHEVTWRLEPDAFVVENGRKALRIAYGKVATIRLTYRPANVTSQGYRAVLVLSDGRTVAVSNLSWKTYVEVERQDAAYRLLLAELVTRCGRANPGLICRTGQPAPVWAASAVGGIAMLAIFAGAAVWALWRGSWPLAAIALMFLLPFVWQAHAMITKNRPGAFAPDRLPEAVLPPSG
ncbi:hypothetical protein [uncultured Alsobacter sp.]|uniref:hypothetical protein n=1 Tax=uncultured Alsobacter sp. TaxID=1748258 RepID=UPI0025E946DA|nr:hypothetical protein [uncultured Alsobacter sp.]